MRMAEPSYGHGLEGNVVGYRPEPCGSISKDWRSSRPQRGKAARIFRAAAITNELQDEDDEKVPERLADDTVVAIVKVPDMVAFDPDAVTLPLNVTLPEPPATS